jgi:3-oxoacyl-[acyl-carrier-protein] synthase-3
VSGETSIRAVAYALPAATRTVRELAASGALESDASVLERFGFQRVHVAVEESPYELARVAAERLLAAERIDPAAVGLLVYGGPPSAIAFAAAAHAPSAVRALCTTERFQSPAARLQYELGLDGASVVAVDQFACTTLFGAVRVARALCTAEGIDRALCVSGEFYPALAGREALFNCTSDAACALLLERGAGRQRICGAATVTHGYHWDPTVRREETVASYFPTAVRVINSTLVDAGWRKDEVDWVIPHNVSVASWEVLMRLAGLTRARLWTDNVAAHGHTLAGDNFINLHDAVASGAVRAGDRALLFSYGYGAHWTSLAVEV